MKLSADNIKFIESYLKNLGVKYIDIRIEMTDHIASALEDMEGGFYENFKSYMAGHKGLFISTNRKFTNAALVSALRMIGREMLGPWFLVPLSLMLGVFYLIRPLSEDIIVVGAGAFIISSLMFLTARFYIKGGKENLFSVTDKVTVSGWLVISQGYNVLLFLRIKDDYKLACYAFLTALSISVIRAFYKLILNYKFQYYG